MVNGGLFLLKLDRPFPLESASSLRCGGSGQSRRKWPILDVEVGRLRMQVVVCKAGKGDSSFGGGKHVKKIKRKGLDESGNVQTLESSKSISFETSISEDYKYSVASPATEMEMVADEDLDVDDDSEFSIYRGLVLDMAYRPINVVNWKRALVLDILEKADVLEYYDQVVCSPSKAFFIPAVLKVCNFVHAPGPKMVKLSLNRTNVFVRDKFRCQYCYSRDNLTIDHVLAASRGGTWSWDNLVTACSKCNVKKADKTLEEARMRLVQPPQEPRAVNSINLPPNYKTYRSLTRNRNTPIEWEGYLPTNYPRIF